MNQRLGIIVGGIVIFIIIGAGMYQMDKNASKKSILVSSTSAPSEKLIDVNDMLQESNNNESSLNTQKEERPIPSEQPNSNEQLIMNNEELNKNQKKSMTPETGETTQKKYQVVLHTTQGDITIDLNDTSTPKTVENFVSLAKKGFYNTTIFHRVIKGFMIQGGDPECNPEKNSQMCGAGGPGYKFDDEPFEGSYTRGTVAMANSGPNTNGSQFFIMHANYNLPKNYVIFGKVSSGMDAVDKIAEAKMTTGGDGAMSKPLEPVRITSAEVKEIK